MAIYELVTFPNDPDHTYKVDLGARVYELRWLWRERALAWYISIYTLPDPDTLLQVASSNTGTLLTTKRLKPGRPWAVPGIEGQFFPWGRETGEQEDLGVIYGLLFVTED